MSEATEATGTVVKGGEIAAKAERAREHLRQLAVVSAADTTDADEIADRQAVAILSAETVDDVWDADTGTAIQCRDAIGLEVQINGFRVLEGNDPGKQTRSGTYVTMDAVCMGGPNDLLRKLGLSPGLEFALQTGAELIVMKLLKFQSLDAFPVRALIAGTETRSGNTVL